jgi:hypothetical protein
MGMCTILNIGGCLNRAENHGKKMCFEKLALRAGYFMEAALK